MSKLNEMDVEEVLAFVHDVRPWRDLDETQRDEWVRRVKHIRDNVTTGGEPWTTERLATLFGLAEGGLRKRFDEYSRRSRGVSESWEAPPGARDISGARRALRTDPASVVAELTHAERSALRNAITNAQLTDIESDFTAASAKEPTVKSAQSKLGHAAAPKERYAAGALALFQAMAREAVTLSILIKSEGIRPSDMEFTSETTAEIVEDTYRVEKVAQQIREVVLLLNAEKEMKS